MKRSTKQQIMKRIVIVLLLFISLKSLSQTTGYLRFDTVRIFKQGGTSELYLINSTKDSLGALTNIGGGLTRFIKPKKLNDSTLVIGLDTISLAGNTQLFVPRVSSNDQEIVRFNGTNGDIQGTPGVTANGSGNFSVPSFWSITNASGLQYAMLPLTHGYLTPATSSNNTAFDFATGAQSQSSGNLEMFRVATLYNQTSTAGATDLVIRRTETAVGSGTHNFIRFDGGPSGTTERFSVDRLGRVKVGLLDNGTSSDSVVVWDAATKYLKKVLGSSLITASNGLTKTGNDIQLGGTLTGNTFIEANDKNFYVTQANDIFLLSQLTSDPSKFAQLSMNYNGNVTLRNELNAAQRTDIILQKQNLLLAVDYDINTYINGFVMDTTFSYTNSRFAFFDQKRDDLSITDNILSSAVHVFGDVNIRDTLKVGLLPDGNSDDSVVVWRAGTKTLRKVAQSSISGGGGGTPGGSDTQLQYNNSGAFDGTAGMTWDATNTGITIDKASLGVTQNNSAGFRLRNPTAAAAGAQQMSPGLFWEGQGWKTNATAASQTVVFRADVTPVQAAANPTAQWILGSSINGAAFTNNILVANNGNTTIGGTLTMNGSIFAVPSTGQVNFTSRSILTSSADGNFLMRNQALNNFNQLQFGGTTSSFPSLLRSSAKLVARLADNSANTDIEVLDQAYDATTWNGNNDVPTKNAVRDEIEAIRYRPYSTTHSYAIVAQNGTTPVNLTAVGLAMDIPNSSTGWIKVVLTGNGNSGSTSHGIKGIKYYSFNKTGGTLTLDAADVIVADKKGASVTGATWQLTVSSNQPVVEVTGVAGVDMNWVAAIEVLYITE